MTHEPAIAALWGLLLAGELSAEAAFPRIARRLTRAGAAHAASTLQPLAKDEARHHALLLAYQPPGTGQAVHPRAALRRFFRHLENREPTVHLARVAALDGCVCQVLARVLAAPGACAIAEPLRATLATIRADEGEHVRVSRRLALQLGASAASLAEQTEVTRVRFASLLAAYEAAFTALGVDTYDLLWRIRRRDG